MGIEFREGSLLITSKNNHVAKKGEITNKPRNKDLYISQFLSNQKYINFWGNTVRIYMK